MVKKKILIASLMATLLLVSISLLKRNVVQTFKIPSGNMQPTLEPGDRILAKKSVNYVPRRGDVIVYRYPKDRSKSYIGRVVALGGESIEIGDGNVYINGLKLEDSAVQEIRYLSVGQFEAEGRPFSVPDGSLFVLGDNTRNSRDSRYWGPLPAADVIGRAYKIYWPMNRAGPIQ